MYLIRVRRMELQYHLLWDAVLGARRLQFGYYDCTSSRGHWRGVGVFLGFLLSPTSISSRVTFTKYQVFPNPSLPTISVEPEDNEIKLSKPCAATAVCV